MGHQPQTSKILNLGNWPEKQNDGQLFKITMDPENFFKITSKYVFGDCLGQGSFAKVYAAYDIDTHQELAIKVLEKEKMSQGKRREMAQLEIDVMREMMLKRKNKEDAANLCELYALYEDKKRVSQGCLELTLGLYGDGKMWVEDPEQALQNAGE